MDSSAVDRQKRRIALDIEDLADQVRSSDVESELKRIARELDRLDLGWFE